MTNSSMLKYDGSLAKLNKGTGVKHPNIAVLVQDAEKLELVPQEVRFDGKLEEIFNHKEMTCADYIDHLWNHSYYETSIQEMKFEDSFRAERLMKATVHQANSDNVYLIDLNDFDYETEFWNMYKNWQL